MWNEKYHSNLKCTHRFDVWMNRSMLINCVESNRFWLKIWCDSKPRVAIFLSPFPWTVFERDIFISKKFMQMLDFQLKSKFPSILWVSSSPKLWAKLEKTSWKESSQETCSVAHLNKENHCFAVLIEISKLDAVHEDDAL